MQHILIHYFMTMCELSLSLCLVLSHAFWRFVFQDNLGDIYLQLAGVSLLAQKDWLLVMHLSF